MGKSKKVISDATLVQKIKFGDSQSLEEIVRRYSDKVYSLAYHLTRDTSAAEEIMQEVFLTVISKISSLEKNSYFATWLYRVTTNASYGFLRKEKKFTDKAHVEHIEDEQALSYDWSSLPDDILLSEESSTILHKAIDSLPETMRAVVVMKDVEGLKNEEIAQAMDLSIPAVKSRLHRGRLILRQALSEYYSKYAQPEGGSA